MVRDTIKTRHRSWWAWLLNLPPRAPTTRLTAEEAVAIAAADPAVIALDQELPVANAHEQDGRIIWTIGSGGIGSQWWVEIDDETSVVGTIKQFSGR